MPKPIFKHDSIHKGISIAALILFIFTVYFNSLFNGFVYDDNTQILGNRWITDLRHIPEILTSSATGFQNQPANTYRPGLHLALMAEYNLFGFSAWGYHLISIIIHAANAVLVFMTAHYLLGRDTSKELSLKCRASVGYPEYREYIPPFLAGALFAVHTINSESVLWASAITELLYVFFILVSFNLYVGSRNNGSVIFYVLSLTAFFFGLLSKETAISLIVFIAVYGFSTQGFGFAREWKNYAPFIVVLAVYSLLRTYSVGGFISHKQVDFSASETFINIFPLLFQYMWKLALPLNLSAIYVLNPARSFFDPLVIAGVLTIAAWAALVFYFRKVRSLCFLLFWVLVPILPVLYIPALSNSAFAERYLYLSSAGYAMIAAYLVKKSLFSRRLDKQDKSITFILTVLISSIMVVTYSAGTVKRISVWKNDFSLWQDAAAKAPESRIAHYNLAMAYLAQKNKESAIAHFKEATRIYPDYDSAYYNLAWIYQSQGDLDAAAANYKEVIRIDPRASDAHFNLGGIYKTRGLYGQAIDEFRAALSINRSYREAEDELRSTILLQSTRHE